MFGIEFDGVRWHSTNFTKTTKDYHLKKTEECEALGITLIHVFENEWKYKRDLVESIIRSKLGIFDQTIYARKCQVKCLDNSEYKEFLIDNHLQGYVAAKLRLGLLYNDELVACIGIGGSRFKKGETELIRFCTKKGVRIIGGLSKLIKHSKVKDLVSYVDRRYFNGSGYRKAGFELIGKTSPGYIYVKGNSILSRYQCQKHKLSLLLRDKFDPNLSEVENMTTAGYFQLYDCGMLKFRWKS